MEAVPEIDLCHVTIMSQGFIMVVAGIRFGGRRGPVWLWQGCVLVVVTQGPLW